MKKVIPAKTKVACLGIMPEILQYHGYYTLGGYYSLHSVKYSKLMLKVLGKEKEKLNIKGFVNRCVLKSKELSDGAAVIQNLQLDFELMKSEGYHYLVSKKEIEMKGFKDIYSGRTSANDSLYLYVF